MQSPLEAKRREKRPPKETAHYAPLCKRVQGAPYILRTSHKHKGKNFVPSIFHGSSVRVCGYARVRAVHVRWLAKHVWKFYRWNESVTMEFFETSLDIFTANPINIRTLNTETFTFETHSNFILFENVCMSRNKLVSEDTFLLENIINCHTHIVCKNIGYEDGSLFLYNNPQKRYIRFRLIFKVR